MIRTLGIRREDKNKWERRVPLVPEHVRQLLLDRPEAAVVVQPSGIRVIEDDQYREAGANVDENLKVCDAVIGVKEMPVSLFQRGKVYLFFSHTIKGQAHNMPMLKKLLELGCTLIDYEKIVDDKGRRLVFFGHYAGLAGMIDTLWALGKRFEFEGKKTPFAGIQPAHAFKNLEEAKAAVKTAGELMKKRGLPSGVPPVVVGFTGYGNVSKGAQEIFDLLPHREISPEELLMGVGRSLDSTCMGKVVFHERHTVKPKTASEAFDLQDYFRNPGNYRSTFRPYADYLTALVNCIYWTPQSPMVLTKKDAADLWKPGNDPQLKVIGDISCDIGGGIEFTLKETTPDAPIFTYDPVSQRAIDGEKGHGPVVMAVDNLPCELPLESSRGFSEALKAFIHGLFDLDLTMSFDQCHLPDPLKKATIVWRGELTPDFQYLKKYL